MRELVPFFPLIHLVFIVTANLTPLLMIFVFVCVCVSSLKLLLSSFMIHDLKTQFLKIENPIQEYQDSMAKVESIKATLVVRRITY